MDNRSPAAVGARAVSFLRSFAGGLPLERCADCALQPTHGPW
jgi:hypothetical protein